MLSKYVVKHVNRLVRIVSCSVMTPGGPPEMRALASCIRPNWHYAYITDQERIHIILRTHDHQLAFHVMAWSVHAPTHLELSVCKLHNGSWWHRSSACDSPTYYGSGVRAFTAARNEAISWLHLLGTGPPAPMPRLENPEVPFQLYCERLLFW